MRDLRDSLETKSADRRFGRENGRSAVTETGFVRVVGYRLYGLDRVDKVASAQWIEAEDDVAAVEAVEKMMNGHDCELWQGTRLVARIAHRRDG